VKEHTENGKAFRILNIIDEYTRECLATFVARSIKAEDVLDQLFNQFVFRGVPEHIRSDNGPEFTAKAVRKWLNQMEVKTLFIEPGSPWENGYIESFNGKMRDELLNREIFTTLEEAKVLINQWRKEYNHPTTQRQELPSTRARDYISRSYHITCGTTIGGRSGRGQN
jgi:transposase InsO family protein